jgi:hypothetical protein
VKGISADWMGETRPPGALAVRETRPEVALAEGNAPGGCVGGGKRARRSRSTGLRPSGRQAPESQPGNSRRVLGRRQGGARRSARASSDGGLVFPATRPVNREHGAVFGDVKIVLENHGC